MGKVSDFWLFKIMRKVSDFLLVKKNEMDISGFRAIFEKKWHFLLFGGDNFRPKKIFPQLKISGR